ncbi:MAG: hypothetical protein QM709_13890 [Spongiibacteraceae bacterium]
MAAEMLIARRVFSAGGVGNALKLAGILAVWDGFFIGFPTGYLMINFCESLILQCLWVRGGGWLSAAETAHSSG